jgi:hypothetical protein
MMGRPAIRPNRQTCDGLRSCTTPLGPPPSAGAPTVAISSEWYAWARFPRALDRKGHWHLVYPRVFQDGDMLMAARRQLSGCQGRPMLMGRSAGAYEALMTLTEMAER